MSSIFFQLLVGHAIADFALQSDTMAREKRPNKIFWHYWLFAHSLTHGGMVYIVTDNYLFGVAETILHFLCDYCKCRRWLTVHQDQFLHILCKLGYVTTLLYFAT